MSLENRLRGEVEDLLQPGERLLATSFGLVGLGQKTERTLLILGLYLIGSLLIFIFSDRAYIALTDRRLLWIELSPKYKYSGDVIELSRDLIRNVRVDQSGLFRRIHFCHAERCLTLRCTTFFGKLRTLDQHSANLAAELAKIDESRSPEENAALQAAADVTSQSLAKQQARSTRSTILFFAIWLPLTVAVMLASTVVGDKLIGGLENAPPWQVNTLSAATFLAAPYITYRLARRVSK